MKDKIFFFVNIIFMGLLDMSIVFAQHDDHKYRDLDIHKLELQAVKGLKSTSIKLPINKPIILEFGSMGCKPCLESLVKMDSLSKISNNEVAMYMVTSEKSSFIKKFKQRSDYIRNVEIPIIFEDSILKKKFPHHAFPHLVWINKEGKIIESNHHYLSFENLKRLIKSEKLDVVEKNDRYFNYSKGILSVNESWGSEGPHYFIGGYLNGIFPKKLVSIDSSRNIRRYAAYNYNLVRIFSPFFNRIHGVNLFNNQIKAVGFDLDNVIIPYNKVEYYKWRLKNSYTYEIEFSGLNKMPEDEATIINLLENYFSLKVFEENRKIKSWCIVPYKKIDNNVGEIKNTHEKQRIGLFEFCRYLNNNLLDSHFFYEDELIQKENLFINYTSFIFDIDKIKLFLENHGYTIISRETIQKVLVFEKL